MSDLSWRVVSDTESHKIIAADAHYGEWMISTIKPKSHYAGELFREVKIKLRLRHPELSFSDVVMRTLELRKQDEENGTTDNDDEIDRLHHYSWGQEIAMAQGWREALLFVQMLHEGDAGLPSFNEMMAQGDFHYRREFENQRGTIKYFDHGSVKSMSLVLIEGEESFDLDLNRANGIYIVGRLSLYGREGGHRRRMSALPPHIEDYRRVGLRWTAEVIKLRKARGGMFRKPIIDDADPFPVGL